MIEQVSDDPTYYDRPVLKEPVWIWAVPLYFYVGGVSGAAMTLGAAAQIVNHGQLERFVKRCRMVGGIGGGIGTALLIYDLGRPSRFLNMMRVFRPTSPMNLGAWVLAGAAPIAMGAALWSHKPGFRGQLANCAGIIAGLLGMPLAGYTSVLIANTAIPVWQGARHTIPFQFVSSAMASVASLFDLFRNNPREWQVISKFGTIGRVAELVATVAVEREAARVPAVARPLKNGASGAILKAATALTAASLIASAFPRQSRKTRIAVGILGTLGSIALRYGVYYAGRASAADPRATFHPQRAALESRDS